MNSHHPPDLHNEFTALQSHLSSPFEKVDFDDDDIAPISREEDPGIETKLNQIFGIESRPD